MANYSVRRGAMFHARRIAVVTWPKFLQRERTTAVSRTGKWILQEYITPTCSAATTSTKIPQQAVKKATIKSTGHETQRTKDCDLLQESCNTRTSNFSVEMKNANFLTCCHKYRVFTLEKSLFTEGLLYKNC